jgi:hypothetical protein
VAPPAANLDLVDGGDLRGLESSNLAATGVDAHDAIAIVPVELRSNGTPNSSG